MSSPDLGPLEAVQIASNITARELARGTALRDIPGLHPRAFEHLTPAQRTEARRYGVAAFTFTQAVENLPPGASIGDLPEIVPEARPGGLWDVTLRAPRPAQEGDATVTPYTVLVAGAPYQTRESIGAAAVRGVSPAVQQYLDDDPVQHMVYVPFDTHKD